MNQQDAILTRFAPLHPKRIDLSLGRIERLLADLGAPQKCLPPVVHVAGTNGKGSTIAFMRAALEAAGKRVHVYTSPHLIRFNERIRVAGDLVDDERMFAAFDRCEAVNAGQSISVFEITTAAAILLFSEIPADYLLLEVGLGGRYDATNVIERPVATVITPVSMDHPEFLGETVEKIAYEKAGILKKGAPAIIAEQDSRALDVIEREAFRVGARPIVGGRDFTMHEENGRLVFQDSVGLLDMPLPRLVGRHQHINAANALAALRAIEPDLGARVLEQGLAEADWPARLQRLRSGRLVDLAPPRAELWLDGGHNEEGGRVLAEAMADFEDQASRPLVLICGTLSTKDTAGFLRHFKGLAQETLAVPISGEHAGRPAEEVAAFAQSVGLNAAACQSVEAALRFLAARDWPVPPRVLIAGSLYLAGLVLEANGTLLR
ncbi:folylpolyglutamate synthase/dihydrofolate synthase family protein [Methylocapsa sp. S129]|uniref:bifunctional folylpolyglutamate synthase/dihydrofolate synthase n=1 Tax=Methylocapsa sp. S129 TaxID=1641869 RepID=UPI00131E84DE|nr:folylpolyglutamate synthase/dihydrofolate synthase family protein [Methylocapsa sp. S129]